MGFLFAISAALLWGIVYSVEQQILLTVSPYTIIFIHSVLQALILSPYIFLHQNELSTLVRVDNKVFGILLFTIVLSVLANLCILFAIKYLGASTASIFEITYPLFVVVISYVLYKNSMTVAFLVGAILIFLGSLIIIRFNH